MKRHTRFCTAAALVAAAAASSVVIPATATPARAYDDNDQPTREELMSEIRELKRRLDAVEQSREETDEVHETLHEVLADAEARSRLLRFGSDLDPAGYDKTFFIRSSDGNFSLQ